jgi:uncharacterized protein (TIGR00375 family)
MHLLADLHIHSSYSIGTSRQMDLPHLRASCRWKGLCVLGSGDALQPDWRATCQTFQEEGGEILLLPSAEVEDAQRVHHLILMEEFEGFADLAGELAPFSRNLTKAGRPRVNLTGEAIAQKVHVRNGCIGPAHAFTPYTSLYARFDHLAECYGEERIDFLELGLSADTRDGSGIRELEGIPFLSNSDAHGPEPIRLGREWNCISVQKPTVRQVLEGIQRGAIVYNAGLFPEEGKYNRTACSRCYRQYSLPEAVRLRWRCPVDKGRIKKGVADRVQELGGGRMDRRPPYHHMIPLGFILQHVLGTASPSTKQCRRLYIHLIETLGTEIEILLKRSIPEIMLVHPGVGEAIDALRQGRVHLEAGGGGRYGTFSLGKRKD